ncbi:MAG: dihydropteroate synthase [Sneathiella sp.]|nr:dihydropteroate synthase [Sneathiella sp.]
MNLRQKGSALPRGLSLSDKVYLAPVFSMAGEERVSVAVRFSSKELFLSEYTLAEVEGWAKSEDHLGLSILDQLGFLKNLNRYNLIGSRDTPLIMGLMNVTPDSFSDGGLFQTTEAAVKQAITLRDAGADILDIGGESTRPGADFVDSNEELDRVLPVIEKCRNLGPLLSIDTRKSAVMDAAIEAGAGLINDVTALEYDPKSMAVAVKKHVPVCLMHSSADPKVMQDNPTYDHVLFDVIDYLRSRVEKCLEAGMKRDQIYIDPGIGFGKTLDHNRILLKGLRFFHGLGCPVLLGVSRKSFISQIDRPSEASERMGGSLSALLQGLTAGVQIFRVHDVAETRQAIKVWQSIDKTGLTP